MTREEVKKLLDNTKVYVNGKSKEIQEKLFPLGYLWPDKDFKAQYTEEPFLFLSNNEITHSSNMILFKSHRYKEITAEEILSLETELYRPFKDQEECFNEMLKHQPFGWICVNSKYYQIVVVVDSGIKFSNDYFTFDEVVDYTFLDGTPFGIGV